MQTKLDKRLLQINFIFAEIEENESELEKLEEWLRKIVVRDFFSAPLKTPSGDALEKCKDMLEDYSSKVYELNSGISE